MPSSDSFNVGLVGLGTVGTGVIKMLDQNAGLIAQRAGRPIKIISVTASNKNKDRGVDLSSYEWVDHAQDMCTDDRLDAIVEMVGGSEGFAKDLVEGALKAGKHVVTANKALLAEHGAALAELAESQKVCLAYEAAVAGGIPIIKTLREGLAGNQINSIHGILNGTCNYILTEMRETGRDFSDVLKEAQEKGYAEADPTFDVDGIDAAHKLVLLGALAFGVKPDFKALNITGIRHITAQDIQYADELGYRIKLLGTARREGSSYMQTMEPCLVSKKSALGNVEGVFNAVMTQGDFVDKTMMEGRGAGEGPTASSIVADIIDLAKGNGLPTFGISAKDLKETKWQGPENIVGKCYIHLHVQDDAGVLADITSCLKDQKISIESVIQRGHEDETSGAASVVILTHTARFADVKESVKNIESLKTTINAPTILRVEKL
ncbi:MAG: homoserine dehydrogenase [Alphaproteobacteria bacterium]|nr:homoserine dehydrogenase [Alphaproteobacteria bacterium]